MGLFAKGTQSAIYIGKQSSESDLATNFFKIPFNSSSLGSSTNMTDAETITGKRDAKRPIMGNHDVTGSITVPLDCTTFGLYLAMGFGEVYNSGTHTFTVSDEMPSFTIVQAIPMGGSTYYDVFIGCKLNSMSFEIGGDGELTADLDIMGMKHEGKTEMPTGISTATTLDFDRIVALNAEAPTRSSSTITVAKSFSVNVDFGLDGDSYFLGADGYRGTISEGILTATGTLNCMLNDTSLLIVASNGTETSLSIKAVGYEDTKYMQISFANVMFEEATPNIEGPRGIAVDFNYHAYSTDNTSSVTIVLKNELENAYYAS